MPGKFKHDRLYRLGLLVYGKRWLVVAFWVAILAAALPFVPGASRSLSPGGFSTSRLEAAQASTEIQRTLNENPAALERLLNLAAQSAWLARQIAEHPGYVRAFMDHYGDLEGKMRQKIRARRKEYFDRICGIIIQGIESGRFRRCDPRAGQ